LGASTTFTFDLATPRRPSLEDLGGDDYEDDPEFPPDKTTMPNADEHNERARNQTGINRVLYVALLHVTFSGGNPSIANVRGMRTALVSGDFVVTDNAAGDTSITWASSVLPASPVPPTVSLAQDVEIDRVRAYLITNGVRVKTKLGATGTDCGFVLLIH